MEPDKNKRPTGENSPIGKKETPLSSRSTQQQGPKGEPKKSNSWKEHDNPIVRGIARVGLWVWIVVMAVGLGLAFLVAFIAI